MDSLIETLATFPSFLAYFLGSGFLLIGFALLYVNTTPHREFMLIRQGNTAAAIALSGALLGFAIPLASVIANSARLVEVLVWGVVAMIVQFLGYLASRMILPGLSNAIERGQTSHAIFLAAFSVTLGILDAACMAG